MDCAEIKAHGYLQKKLKENNKELPEDVVTCFFKLYYNNLKSYAFKTFLFRYKTDITTKDALVWDAFTESIIVFLQSVKQKGFTARETNFDNYFLGFFRFRLMGILKKRNNENKKLYQGDNDIAIDNAGNTGGEDPQLIKEFLEAEEEKKKLFDKGLMQLDKQCRELVINRKINNMGREDAANIRGVSIESINNTLLRCMKEFKLIINNLKQDKSL